MKKDKIKLIPFQQLKDRWMKDPQFKQAYEDLELEFQLIGAIISARIKGGVTQAQLAKKAGTKQSAISRFESGSYNPSLQFVKKLSNALDLRLTLTGRQWMVC